VPRKSKVYVPEKQNKEAKVTAEIERLRDIFKDLKQERKTLAEKAISRAAWLIVSLEELEECIDRTGYVVEYKNGENQYGTKKSPEVETHNSMSQRYTQVMDYLYKLLPDTKSADDGAAKDTVKEFIKSRPKLPKG